MKSFPTMVLAVAGLAVAAPAAAHHRQTDKVVPLTTSGDTPLPRQPAPGTKTLVLSVEWGSGRRVVSISPWRDRRNPTAQTVIAESGAHANPVISATGRAFAFDSASDPLGLGLPGRQVVGALRKTQFPVSEDTTGTSINPSIDGVGRRVAFESTADLAGTGTPGVRQVFLREVDGSIRRLSRGLGASRNPVLSPKRNLVLFESSSDPTTGAETNVAQIWIGDADAGDVAPITAAFGPSMNPAVSNDGRLVVLESTADLKGTQLDTGVPQIYLYDTKSRTYARITNEALGCRLPSVYKVLRDWRIAYVCNGVPYFTMVRADQRYVVPTPSGVTQRIAAVLGVHFIVLSTTADLFEDAGTTPGNQVYLVNLYKRPAVPVPGQVAWFPSQGLPPL